MQHLERDALSVAMRGRVDRRHSAQPEQLVETPSLAQNSAQPVFGATELIFVARATRFGPINGTTKGSTGHTYLDAVRHIPKSIKSRRSHRI
jgi:hypothetical protein